MKNFSTLQKKQLFIYGIIAFLIPYLMGFFMWFGYGKGYDLSVFPNAQMMYPAAGAILAMWLTKQKEEAIPKRFFITYLVFTLILFISSIVSVFMPSDMIWLIVANFVFIIGSIMALIMILTDKKEIRTAYGLRANNTPGSIFCVTLFLFIYFLRTIIAYSLGGQLADFFGIFKTATPWIMIACLPINFFFVFIAFFGEEYGWRYFLQPMLQNRFGKRIGVIVLGVIWGLWHLPINYFYYSPGTGLESAATQQITCITLGIFFAYAYMKTQNIWVPVILHYLNNNLVPIISGTFTADVLQDQHTTWETFLPSLIINGLLFGSFILMKEFRKEKEDSIKVC